MAEEIPEYRFLKTLRFNPVIPLLTTNPNLVNYLRAPYMCDDIKCVSRSGL